MHHQKHGSHERCQRGRSSRPKITFVKLLQELETICTCDVTHKDQKATRKIVDDHGKCVVFRLPKEYSEGGRTKKCQHKLLINLFLPCRSVMSLGICPEARPALFCQMKLSCGTCNVHEIMYNFLSALDAARIMDTHIHLPLAAGAYYRI